MTTMNVKNGDGTTETVEKPLPPGRAAASASKPVALSNEDLAAVGAITETPPANDTASSGLNGRLQRVAQNLTTFFGVKVTAITALGTGGSGVIGWLSQIWERLNTLLPAALGQGTMAQSLKVVVASDQSTLPVNPGASSSSGGIASTARLASAAASTNATNIKTSAGRIYSIQCKNNAAYDVFLVLYDSATNPPVPGTTTIRKKICLPALSGFTINWPLGLYFATGIGFALTKLVADADTTVLVAADITALNVDYM